MAFCTNGKLCFPSASEALKALRNLSRKKKEGYRGHPYKCHRCSAFHITRVGDVGEMKNKAYRNREQQRQLKSRKKETQAYD